MEITEFTQDVIDFLGDYVYCLTVKYPGEERERVFYIGKGKGNRVFEHEKNNDTDFTKKGFFITDIKEQKGKIKKYIIQCCMKRTGEISESEIALLTESALINFAKLQDVELTNTADGHGVLKKAWLVEDIQNYYSKSAVNIRKEFNNFRIATITFPVTQNTEINSLLSYLKNKEFEMIKDNKFPINLLCVIQSKVIRGVFEVSTDYHHHTNNQGKYHLFVQFPKIRMYDMNSEYIGRRIIGGGDTKKENYYRIRLI